MSTIKIKVKITHMEESSLVLLATICQNPTDTKNIYNKVSPWTVFTLQFYKNEEYENTSSRDFQNFQWKREQWQQTQLTITAGPQVHK